ncbi:hypothetical protein BS78_K229700 [Paspalum vaginatum]|uniref:Uncharacterized protein n=1 Tax=Paspalum vaginatum TaxID=158149 RepID=A0A9W8CGS5_9POAL|nr:hypothetical protein BS78_K229700 [Paspalum vaginatum]
MISSRMWKFTLPPFTYFGTPILTQPPFMRISAGVDSLCVTKIQETVPLNFLNSPPQCRQNTGILGFSNSSIWTSLKLPNSITGFMVPDILTYMIFIFICHTHILLYFCSYQRETPNLCHHLPQRIQLPPN